MGLMGKRSNFERVPRDFYPTPKEAVIPLMNHLDIPPGWFRFYEPCAGDGALVRHLITLSRRNCAFHASDIEPKEKDGEYRDALTLAEKDLENYDYIITNPPWDRKILHPMISHFRGLKPTWLLFDADWMHTKQAAMHLQYCEKIVSVGRIKWIPDSKMTGKDNCAWYKFVNHETETTFYGR